MWLVQVVTARPAALFTGKDPLLTVGEAGWAPGSVWAVAENFAFTGIRSPDRPPRSELLYRLSYPGPHLNQVSLLITFKINTFIFYNNEISVLICHVVYTLSL
jgi:hypothetical protein